MSVIKAKNLKPITNGEKILEIFPDADFEEFCPLGLVPSYTSPADCDLYDCEDCTTEFLSQPYQQPHREYSTKENTTVDYHE